MTKDDFCLRYDVEIDNNKFIEIRYIVTLALQKLKLPRNKLLVAEYPLKPLILDTALSIQKGCSKYYKMIMLPKYLNNKNYVRENKWQSVGVRAVD